MNKICHLHFTFGPVQSFVAQARRTRDLYAGSYLLSHLALKAMGAVPAADERVILPDYKTLRTLTDRPHAIAPNRFVAKFNDKAEAGTAGQIAAEALHEDWRQISGKVWDRFLRPVGEQDSITRTIWERQIASFWEIAWAVGDENETNLLDRRKNWRTPPTTEEPGDHCTLMPEWQELSGFIRSKERKEQDDFWAAVRSRIGRNLDLEDDERLCAISFVKRFFPAVLKEVTGLDMQSWPSTVSIAAVPWLKETWSIFEQKPKILDAARDYAEMIRGEPGDFVGSGRRLGALQGFLKNAGNFAQLSGNFLNRTALKNKRGTPLKDETLRPQLLDQLKQLEKATGERAGNFYGLLLMDGDSMGKLVHEHTAETVTPCLTRFASSVPALIENERHSGICVYAGGDDLLAMLPLDNSLEAVCKARDLYVQAFAGSERPINNATISAGLVFAHYRCAFSRVLEYAHELLDDVAKDGADHDAIAMGVLKPGGVACQWVGKFNDFIQGGSHCFEPLIKAYRKEANREGSGLSSSFLYNLRERFGELLEPVESLRPCDEIPSDAPVAELFDGESLLRLFVAEYLHGRLDSDPAKARQQREEAIRLMERLLAVCRHPDPCKPDKYRLNLEGARLVKFLALDGKEGAE